MLLVLYIWRCKVAASSLSRRTKTNKKRKKRQKPISPGSVREYKRTHIARQMHTARHSARPTALAPRVPRFTITARSKLYRSAPAVLQETRLGGYAAPGVNPIRDVLESTVNPFPVPELCENPSAPVPAYPGGKPEVSVNLVSVDGHPMLVWVNRKPVGVNPLWKLKKDPETKTENSNCRSMSCSPKRSPDDGETRRLQH